jgi:predicted enzyme related to lactoylglutathione lyase
LSETQNTIGYFEASTNDMKGLEEFYGKIFNWKFEKTIDERLTFIKIPGQDDLVGGIWDHRDEYPSWVLFGVRVDDVEEAGRRAEEAGAKVAFPFERVEGLPSPTGANNGVLKHVQLFDPAGNRFAMFNFSIADEDAES